MLRINTIWPMCGGWFCAFFCVFAKETGKKGVKAIVSADLMPSGLLSARFCLNLLQDTFDGYLRSLDKQQFHK